MKLNNKSLLLYAVTDRRWSDNDTFYKHIEESLEGGVTFLQLREKNLDIDSFFKEAIKIKELCKKYNVPFIINDNVEIALKSNADGIHVGQDDMGVEEVREEHVGDRDEDEADEYFPDQAVGAQAERRRDHVARQRLRFLCQRLRVESLPFLLHCGKNSG